MNDRGEGGGAGVTASGRTRPCCGRWLDGGNDCTADAWPKFRVAERVLGLTGVFFHAVESLEFHVGEGRCVQCVCDDGGMGCVHLGRTGLGSFIYCDCHKCTKMFPLHPPTWWIGPSQRPVATEFTVWTFPNARKRHAAGSLLALGDAPVGLVLSIFGLPRVEDTD